MITRLKLTDVFELSKAALAGSGASQAHAEQVAQSIMDAEAEGSRNVGLPYLLHYCEHLRCGKLDGKVLPTLEMRSPTAIFVDAKNGFCHTAFVCAEAKFVALAGEMGVACLMISRSYTAGALGWFVQRLAKEGLVAMAFTNSSPLVAAWGGKRRFLGTNPLAFAAPRKGQPPLVIDMSTSATARVNVVEAASKGGPIPAGWAMDRDGKPTTDPQKALEGTVASMGGYKGFCLAILVEVLAVGLTGANWTFQVPPLSSKEGGPMGLGQFFLAFAPDRLGTAAFGDRLEILFKEMLLEEGVRIPGSRRHAGRERAEREGVEVPSSLINKLRDCADLPPAVSLH